MLRPFLLALLASPCLAAVAHADTFDEALSAAYRNNPALVDARLAVRAAQEDRVQANAAYLPSLGVSANYGAQEIEIESQGFFGPQTTTRQLDPWSSTVQLQQQLYTGGRRSGQSRLARAGIEGARYGLRSTEQDVLLAATDAYLSVLRDQELLRLNEEHVEGLTRQLGGTRRRLDVGEVSRTDLAQAQARLSGARAALARAGSDLESSRARYIAVVGAPPEALQPVPMPDTPDSLDGAVRQANAQHPELLQAQSAVRAARARVDIERSALLPQVAVVGRYESSDEFSGVDDRRDASSAVAQFSVPLFEGGLAASRTRQGRLNVQRAEARVELRRREIIASIVAAWNDLNAGRDVVTAAEEQVAATEEAVAGTERERGLGLRSTLDVLNAEEERRNAQVALARAEAEAKFAAYALLAATGALTIEGLGLDD